MKKPLLFIFATIFTNISIAQYTTIPDSNFEQALIDLGYDNVKDGKVFTANVSNVDSLNLFKKNISDLTGIEALTNLKKLHCNSNNLLSLDVSQNTSLNELNCYYNNLTNLDVSKNINLQILACGGNKLTNLDLSKNIALTDLDCNNNQIQSLNLFYNKALVNLYCNSNGLTNLNVTNNVSLTSLGCDYNNLTSLNISNNTSLLSLGCAFNNLSNLDISKNPLLTFLACQNNYLSSLIIANKFNLQDIYCNDNQLTKLIVYNNTSLTDLYCYNNNLTNIDVSTNPKLTDFSCENNILTNLDLSNNTSLLYIKCFNNNMSALDIRNGKNTNIQELKTKNNTNLDCIMVDNPYYSNSNWKDTSNYYTDFWSKYSSIPCAKNQIKGNIFIDENNNCIKETLEKGMSNIMVKAKSTFEDLFTRSDTLGNYSFLVNSNETYTLKASFIENSNSIENICFGNGFEINSGVEGTILENIDLGINFKDCSLLSVEIEKERMRRCFTTNTNIIYKNEGATEEPNAQLFIDYPDYVEIVSANKTFTLVNQVEKIYKFNIGKIEAFSEGEIIILDSVICGNESIRGFTQCIKSWITPKSYCAEIKDTTAWDKSSIMIVKNPECIGDSIARFTIINQGSGNMTSFQEYRFYYNNELAYTGTFKLNSGDSLTLNTTAEGSTIRLEADQHPLHPGNSKPRATIEGCGTNGNLDKLSIGFWVNIPPDDLDYDVSEVCLEIRDSYDPNDKKVSPSGITENNYVPEKQNLEYKIRFQNTGSDVAYNIVVIDTLSNQLDASTLKITGASHNYKFDIRGGEKTFIIVTFNNINLPDSTTNEAESHGFISFSISPINNIVPYTVIKNFADIYFDYNSAIRTDTAMVTALDTVVNSDKTITVSEILSTPLGISKNELLNINIFPNPTYDFIIIEGANEEFNQVKIYDIKGSILINETLSIENKKVNVKSLSNGIYFIKLGNKNVDSYSFKMIKQ